MLPFSSVQYVQLYRTIAPLFAIHYDTGEYEHYILLPRYLFHIVKLNIGLLFKNKKYIGPWEYKT
jgi:hypothetical protein